MKFKNQDLHDLFIEMLFSINSCSEKKKEKKKKEKQTIKLGFLAPTMSFLHDCFGKHIPLVRSLNMQKYEKIMSR